MSHTHFIQKQRKFKVNSTNYEIKNVIDGQIMRLNHIKRTNCDVEIIDHYLYFEGTYIETKIKEVLIDKSIEEYEFASYDIPLPSFLVCQKPGLVVKTKILFDPSKDNNENSSDDTQSPNNSVQQSLVQMNMMDLFDRLVVMKFNDATCPRSSAFFPIIKRLEGNDFSFINCLYMNDVGNQNNKFYCLPIQGPIDYGEGAYPNIVDGLEPFYVIFNENEFASLNLELNKKINQFDDISDLQAATTLLKEMPSALSYHVRDGLNFGLIYKGETIFGYHKNESYRYHPPTPS